MIHEVDASVQALLERARVDVDITFDLPSRDWAAKRTAPTINLYLFDIREDLGRRRVEPEPVRDKDGKVTGRQRPPRRYRLTYLVTAWTQRPEDEHRLLSAILHAFLPHEELPRELLVGGLADEPLPILSSIGLPPPQERSIGEIWSAMGGDLKPSLDLVLSVPFSMGKPLPAGPPVLEEPRFTFDDGDAAEQVGGDGGRRRAGEPETSDEIATTETVHGGKTDEGRVLTVSTMERRA